MIFAEDRSLFIDLCLYVHVLKRLSMHIFPWVDYHNNNNC